jgi:DNA mismatch repair protein MutS2
MEPTPAVELNNRETELAQREEEQAAAVLAALSAALGRRGAALAGMLEAVAVLDAAAARARHAAWLGGVRPAFVGAGEADGGGGGGDPDGASPIWVPGALHPLLLERALDPLPRAPSAFDQPFAADFQAVPTFGAPPPGAGGGQHSKGAAERPPRPRPLDLRVPGNKRVVAITGPNTGAAGRPRRRLLSSCFTSPRIVAAAPPPPGALT